MTAQMAETQFTPVTEPPRSTPWAAIGAGVGVLVVVMGGVWLLSRSSNGNTTEGPDPYAVNLRLADVHLSMAENLAGHSILYVEGTATNSGDKTITRAAVRAEFKDAIGQVVLRTQTPLMMTTERPGYSDAVDLSRSPLRAGQSRPFKLTFEGVPTAWNLQPPDLAIGALTAK